jgi:hypothetical protein
MKTRKRQVLDSTNSIFAYLYAGPANMENWEQHRELSQKVRDQKERILEQLTNALHDK